MSLKCRQKLARLQSVVKLRQPWRETFDSLKRLHGWIVQTETILAAEWHQPGQATEKSKGVLVAERFDAWCAELEQLAASPSLTADEQRCLEHWLEVTGNQRPHLLHCYDVPGLPRTNNDMEGFIRSIKTRYRRISGRKNWNAYLLRYGSGVAYFDSLPQECTSSSEVEKWFGCLSPASWRQARTQGRQRQRVQVVRFRFRLHRQAYLQALEARWAQTLRDT